eukprot:c16210_g1_i1.p1 GENE.c16210_g1_i1~~c16210_g1_i1.p1  ORF type:complete len:679 (+),score=113.08 c16210_g1_i1:27-2039(+)
MDAPQESKSPGRLKRFLWLLVPPVYRRASDTTIKHGRDYYVAFFLSQLSVFLYLILTYDRIETSRKLDAFSDSLSYNAIPAQYIHVLLTHFALMIVERAIYLYRALRLKLLLHVLDVAINLGFMFIRIPQSNRKVFFQNPYLVVWFLFKCVGWYFSAKQIRNGFPPITQSRPWLMFSDNYFVYLLYIVYRAIPFMYELKSILDWACTDTTLILYEWLKFEDLVSILHVARVDVRFWREMPRQKVRWPVKILAGFGLFAVLCVVIWTPLFLFSSDTPGRAPNPVLASTFTVSIPTFGDMYVGRTSTAEIKSLSASDLTRIVGDEYRSLVQRFPGVPGRNALELQEIAWGRSSTSTWTFTPMIKKDLIVTLNATVPRPTPSTSPSPSASPSDEPPPSDTLTASPSVHPSPSSSPSIVRRQLEWSIKLSFERSGIVTCHHEIMRPMTSNETRQLLQVLLSEAQCIEDLRRAEESGDTTGFRLCGSVDIHQATPLFLRLLPKVPTAVLLMDETDQFSLTLSYWVASEQVTWWTIATNTSGTSVPCLDDSAGACVYAFSDSVFALFGGWVLEQGILGIYVVFVYTVGRFFRLTFQNVALRIIYEDMPDVSWPWECCQHVYAARQDGDLQLEYALYRELMELFRDPTSVLQLTGRWHTKGIGYRGTDKPIDDKKKD